MVAVAVCSSLRGDGCYMADGESGYVGCGQGMEGERRCMTLCVESAAFLVLRGGCELRSVRRIM